MSNMIVKDGNSSTKYISTSGEGTASSPFVTRGTIGDAYDDNLPLYQFADTVGDGSGDTNMAVEGTLGTPIIFRVKPPSGVVYRVARLIVTVRDGGSFDSGGWGNNGGTPLTNGIKAYALWDGVQYELTQEPIQSHIDLAALSYDVSHNNWGQGDEFVAFRFTFTKAGRYIKLIGDNADELQFYIQDDLTYLTQQRVSVQGHME